MPAQNQKKPGESAIYKLSQQAVKDSERWFPKTAHDVVHHALSLCGEAGEFANVVKNIDRGDASVQDANIRYKMMMELTDAYTYLLCIAGLLKLDLDASYEHVRGMNEKRFGSQEGKSA